MAAEVTVMRPKAFIGQDWTYYVLVGGKAVTDLVEGERATFQVPADTRSIVIQCPKFGGGYYDTRVNHDFGSSAQAFVLLEPNRDCVNAKVLDARAAAAPLRNTRVRASRPLVYDTPESPQSAPAAAAPAAPAVASAPTAAAVTQSSATTAVTVDQVIAATALWVDAFNNRDATRLGALYDSDAVLTDASEPRPRVGSGAIGEYYKKETKRATQRVALGERNVRVLGDTAIDSGTLTFFEMRDGKATTTPGRYSMTYQNRGGRWVIVDHQVSSR